VFGLEIGFPCCEVVFGLERVLCCEKVFGLEIGFSCCEVVFGLEMVFSC